jgi:hypothetical protein
MLLVNISSFVFALLTVSTIFIFRNHKNNLLPFYFILFLSVSSLSYLVNLHLAATNNPYGNILNLDVKMQYIHLVVTSICGFCAWNISLIITKQYNWRFRSYVLLTTLFYIITSLFIGNVYQASALYMLLALASLTFSFINLFFISLEKEIAYAALGSILLLINKSFEQFAMCLYPTLCECDSYNILSSAIAVALIAKTIHHILYSSTVDESEASLRPVKQKKSLGAKIYFAKVVQ